MHNLKYFCLHKHIVSCNSGLCLTCKLHSMIELYMFICHIPLCVGVWYKVLWLFILSSSSCLQFNFSLWRGFNRSSTPLVPQGPECTNGDSKNNRKRKCQDNIKGNGTFIGQYFYKHVEKGKKHPQIQNHCYLPHLS